MVFAVILYVGKDLGLNTAMVPLGSCTMKLNAVSEMAPVTWSSVSNMHPFAPEWQTKGYQVCASLAALWALVSMYVIRCSLCLSINMCSFRIELCLTAELSFQNTSVRFHQATWNFVDVGVVLSCPVLRPYRCMSTKFIWVARADLCVKVVTPFI